MSPPSISDDLPDSTRMPLMAIARNLSFKIPVWPFLLMIAGGMYSGTRMYFQVEQLDRTMVAVNETMHAVNAQLVEVSRTQERASAEISALRERVARVEAEQQARGRK